MKKQSVSLYRMTVFMFLAMLVYGTSGFAYELRVLTENSGENNYMDADGKIRGHNTEIIREIMHRLNKDFDIELFPWTRGYKTAQIESNVILFSMTRTVAREKMFKWVGPLHVTKFILYKKRDSDLEIRSLDDAKNVSSIGCYKDDVREKFLKAKGFENLVSRYGENVNKKNLELLLKGRNDLWITGSNIMYQTAQSLGVDPAEIQEAFIVKKAYVYMAFSKDTPDFIVSEWQQTLDEVKRDGTYKKIMSKYNEGKMRMTFEPPEPAKADQ